MRLTKKLLSIILAVLMAVSMIPATAYAGQMTWNLVGEMDFTPNSGVSWTGNNDGNVTSSWAVTKTYYRWKKTNYYYSSSTYTDKFGNNFNWNNVSWLNGDWGGNNYTSENALKNAESMQNLFNAPIGNTYDENGIYLTNGYMYTTGTSLPITGVDEFKIDLEFQVAAGSKITDDDTYCLLGLAANNSHNTGKMWNSDNYIFSQDARGKVYVTSTGNKTLGYSSSGNERIAFAANNPFLIADTDYHYLLSCSNGFTRAWVEDDNGNYLFELFASKCDIDTSSIMSIVLGDDDGSDYLTSVRYKNLKFYSGDNAGSSIKGLPVEYNKYVFAFFTGNYDAGESLHLAASDDGYNWEALNGNDPIWNASKLTGSEEIYPAGSGSMGIPVSGHVRDPYAFMAEDGSYYILATDLNTKNGTDWGNNTKLSVWHLDSLADLDQTNPWFIETTPLVSDFVDGGTPSRAWAPQAIWDPEAQHYMLYWSVGFVGGKTEMYYIYTDDFKTFIGKPKKLLADGMFVHSNIDGDITYDGDVYYLYFKDEDDSSKTVHYATSEHACGPYEGITQFMDVKVEGPQVYKIQNTDGYTLLVDYYGSGTNGVMSAYTSLSLDGFAHNENVNTNINHLSPRHGSVINVTTEEYTKLDLKYGTASYDTTALNEGEKANDHLVARYFTTADPTFDATGHGFTLTNNGVNVIPQDYNGKRIAAAQFTGGNSGSKNGPYATIDTTEMFDQYNISAFDGVTFDWYGYSKSSSINDKNNGAMGRFFDWTNAPAGSVVWGGDQFNQNNTVYAYAAANTEFGSSNNGASTVAQGYAGTSYADGWHRYTYSVSHGYINFFVDGILLRSTYKDGIQQASGAPIYNSSINDTYFDTLGNGNLMFGISSYAGDGMLDGYISDFRVYNKALSANDIISSITELESALPSADMTGVEADYYDPMETIEGTSYTEYDKTYYDEIYKNVLRLDGTGEKSHNIDYKGVSSNKGYTIAMWYNPGEAINGDNCIFNIGRLNSDGSGNNFQYFQLNEDGKLWYNWGNGSDESFIDIGDAFGSSSLPLNEWTLVTLQVTPNSDNVGHCYDTIHVYFNKKLVNKINTFTGDYNKAPKADRSITNYLSKPHDVYFGKTCGYWTNNVDGSIDEFRVFSDALDITQLYRYYCKELADSLLLIGIEEYKEAMDRVVDDDGNVTIYTNMYPAYVAYDKAQRYLDSIEYGDCVIAKEEIVLVYEELIDAIEAMQPYTKPETKNGLTPSETGAAQVIDEKYTHNMLSPINLTVAKEYSNGTSDKVNMRVSSTALAWLYTGEEGDTPTAPLYGGAYRNNYKFNVSNYYCDNIHIDTADNNVQLAGNWKFTGNASPAEPAGWRYDTATGGEAGYVRGQSNPVFDIPGENKWYNANNYLQFTGSMPAKNADGENNYYISIDPTFYGQRGYKLNLQSPVYNDDTQQIDFTGTIYVINFVPAKICLQNADRAAFIDNITNYLPKSCMELLAAYDALTSQSYLLGGGGINQVETLVNAIDEEIKAIEGVDITQLVEKADPEGIINEKTAQKEFYDYATEEGNTTQNENGDTIVGALVKDGDSYTEDLNPDTEEQEHYTLSSWKAYENAYGNLTDYFTDLNPFYTDNDYATDQEQLDKLVINVQKAQRSLLVAADYNPVDGAVVNYETDDDGNVISDVKTHKESNNNPQYYSVDSYINFGRAYNAADVWCQKDPTYRADTEKYSINFVTEFHEQFGDEIVVMKHGPYIAYDVDGNIVTDDSQVIDRYVFLGIFYDKPTDNKPSQFETGDYVKINGTVTKLNGHRYYSDISSYDKTTNSVRQQAIIDTAENLIDKDKKLTPVDEPLAYEAFEDTVILADSVAEEKYTPAAIAYINNVIKNSKDGVYLTDADLIKEYNEITGGSYTAESGLKRTGLTETDPYTAAILEAFTTINDSSKKAEYIKQFKAKLTTQTDGANGVDSDLGSKYYGEEFDFSVAEPNDNQYIVWSITMYGYNSNFASDAATASSKIKSIKDNSVSRIADSDMAVVANYVTGDDTEGKTLVKYYNAYGVVVGLDSTADPSSYVPIDTYNDLAKIPFYTFSSWTTDLVDGVLECRPNYSAKETYELSVSEGTISKTTAEYNEAVSIDGSEIENFYAWASYANGVYSIVTYNPTYNFYAVGNEDFYPVIDNNGVYEIGGTPVTAEMVGLNTSFEYGKYKRDYKSDDSEYMTADDFVQAKLANEAPFIGVQRAAAKDGKNYVYCRVTEGYTGCVVKLGDSDEPRGITNILDNGQFYVSSKTYTKFTVGVTYDYTVDFAGTNTDSSQTATISVTDYAAPATF